MVYLRTTLVSFASLFAFVLVFGFPASGQETTASPEAQETATPTQPNGNIGFASASEGGSGSFEMSPNGTGVTPVGRDNDGGNPNWSSDGSKITFVSAEWDIYVMNSDGSNTKRLTASPDFEADPALSPDGSKIAYVRDLPVGQGQILQKIFIMNADGTDKHQLRPEQTFSDYNPDWSPDGSKIAFVRSGAGGSQICTVNVDGSDLTQLTRDPDYTTADPDWSPDGSKILFSRFFGTSLGAKCDVIVMNADGAR